MGGNRKTYGEIVTRDLNELQEQLGYQEEEWNHIYQKENELRERQSVLPYDLVSKSWQALREEKLSLQQRHYKEMVQKYGNVIDHHLTHYQEAIPTNIDAFRSLLSLTYMGSPVIRNIEVLIAEYGFLQESTESA